MDTFLGIFGLIIMIGGIIVSDPNRVLIGCLFCLYAMREK